MRDLDTIRNQELAIAESWKPNSPMTYWGKRDEPNAEGYDHDAPTITTTSGDQFTGRDSCQMAALVYKRFGYNVDCAASAWRRLLGNSCTEEQFLKMAQKGK